MLETQKIYHERFHCLIFHRVYILILRIDKSRFIYRNRGINLGLDERSGSIQSFSHE